jgi:hypothetical protein
VKREAPRQPAAPDRACQSRQGFGCDLGDPAAHALGISQTGIQPA